MLGVGKVEDFTWKGLLDFTTCTECGRCQSQCPAWNTEKPLSPKLLVLNLRDHAYGKAPWLLAAEDGRDGLPDAVKAQAARTLVAPVDPTDPLAGGVIDPDVLWSCTTCGACVEQCPVDIEHVDHVVDMRRYQVLIESAFPSELGGLFRNLESKANPWGMNPRQRLDWAKGLPFEVQQIGVDVDDLSRVDYLFWVGCAGAFEDRAEEDDAGRRRTAPHGRGELRRARRRRVVHGRPGAPVRQRVPLPVSWRMQNVEVLTEARATKIVVTCAHCFNTLKNEYPQLGGNYEVVHHTQLLNRLVREGRLTPVARVTATSATGTATGTATSSATYHDPCYIGRHNGVYDPPRELIGALPGVELREMPRHGNLSFCCGAGGARMWMEERLGTRINANRTEEALATGADQIAVACPFCRVMLGDGLTAKQADGRRRERRGRRRRADAAGRRPPGPEAAGGTGRRLTARARSQRAGTRTAWPRPASPGRARPAGAAEGGQAVCCGARMRCPKRCRSAVDSASRCTTSGCGPEGPVAPDRRPAE